jgi:hypothetical protein
MSNAGGLRARNEAHPCNKLLTNILRRVDDAFKKCSLIDNGIGAFVRPSFFAHGIFILSIAV